MFFIYWISFKVCSSVDHIEFCQAESIENKLVIFVALRSNLILKENMDDYKRNIILIINQKLQSNYIPDQIVFLNFALPSNRHGNFKFIINYINEKNKS